ncbi:T-cell surface glycoprotein CD3 delta chain isoform X1 [Lemur catta]|uniref:T-cell surface glycoprotein CD3 delta chain isoform X1 n=1 Tax=Lemur catta TaxID=9447 RepID=UPI001E26BDA0|nr:T-cell surface glycoprotein CD3 delta chain isoform X1 [Lemur catta]
MEHSRFLAGLILAALLPQVSPFMIPVEELEDRVFLNCNASITWLEGTMGTFLSENKRLDLGKRVLDPRGMYSCNGTDTHGNKVSAVQVYYRMCQNCVELDPASLAGIIITDIIATLLLALGVYCFAGHETGRLSGAPPRSGGCSVQQHWRKLASEEVNVGLVASRNIGYQLYLPSLLSQ